MRAINSVGNIETSFARDEVIVTGSTEDNVMPFASFSVTPYEGSTGTNFTFNASASSDIEDSPNALYVSWDLEGNDDWTAYDGPLLWRCRLQ